MLAGGKAGANETKISVQAKLGDKDWGIVQSPFMRDNASTTGYEYEIEANGDTITYSTTTHLDIYGKTFAHTDKNSLKRVK